MSVFIRNILFVSTLINPIFFLFLKIFYIQLCVCVWLFVSLCANVFGTQLQEPKKTVLLPSYVVQGVSCELSNLNDGNQLQSLKRAVYVLNCRTISPVPLIHFSFYMNMLRPLCMCGYHMHIGGKGIQEREYQLSYNWSYR